MLSNFNWKLKLATEFYIVISIKFLIRDTCVNSHYNILYWKACTVSIGHAPKGPRSDFAP